MPVSKQTRNFLTYLFGILTVFFGTLFLVATAIGWQYDISTGELRETGLILMNSEPSNANIAVDGKDFNNRTPFRYTNVKPGRYEVKYSLANFRPWIKQTSVAAEKVSFADYAWMIPEKIPSRSRYSNQPVKAAWQSLDRKRFVFREQSPDIAGTAVAPRLTSSDDLSRSPNDLYIPPIAATQAIPKTELTKLPATSSTPVTNLDEVEFSNNGNQILVRQTHADATSEWLVMPALPSTNPRVINLTQEFQITPSWIAWGPSGDNEIYYVQSGNLHSLNLNDKKISETLAQSVWAADWSNDVLLSVEGPTADRGLVARPKDNLAKAELIGPIAASQNYQLRYFKLFDDDYLAYLPNDTKTLFISKGIFTKKDHRSTSQAGTNITQFTVNRSGRYLIHNEGNRFVGIDFELNQRYRFNASTEELSKWEWINDQHLVMITGQKLRIIDFDGQNNELITPFATDPNTILFSENKSILIFGSPAEKPLTDPAGTLKNAGLTHFFLNPDRVLE